MFAVRAMCILASLVAVFSICTAAACSSHQPPNFGIPVGHSVCVLRTIQQYRSYDSFEIARNKMYNDTIFI